MPIKGTGWEIHFIRLEEHKKPTNHRRSRTIGTYQIYHDGVAQTGRYMKGMFAETKGPGKNRPENNGHRIEEGYYTLRTQGGKKYVTHGYSTSGKTNASPKPGIELRGVGERTEILIHPGRGFLSSVGCFNLCTNLPDSFEPITYKTSRLRVIAMLDDLADYLGNDFPKRNEKPVPNAHVAVDGEPLL